MSDWVDMDDGVVTLDYGQAGRDIKGAPGKAARAVTQPIANAANAVAQPVRDFQAKGNTEGYGEAIWQDVVKPVAGAMPDGTVGTALGAGGALALDLFDPTPGFSPTNIAMGGAGGYVGGVAGGLAYDAAQALSSPNSLLRGETYSKALEGAGIASGITGDIPVDQSKGMTQEFIQDSPNLARGLHVANSVTEGVNNTLSGALAGANQLGADVTGFIGWDSMQKRLDEDAQGRRDEQTPNSAVGAVAQELAYDAGMGGVLGKAVDVAKLPFQGVKAFQKGNVVSRGTDYVADLLGKAVDINKRTPGAGSSQVRRNIKKLEESGDMYPAARLAADAVGTFSPKTKAFVEKYWDATSAYVLGGAKASGREFNKIKNELVAEGFDTKQIGDILSEIQSKAQLKNMPKNVSKSALDALFKQPDISAMKTLGLGTAILADVED